MSLPDVLLNDWPLRQGPAVLTTVNAQGVPNSVYVGVLHLTDTHQIAMADSAFQKTRDNIATGNPATFLFLTKDFKSYQIKGLLERHTEGPAFAAMKVWNTSQWKDQAKAVVLLTPQEVYSGPERLL